MTSTRFIDNENKTITDSTTGLTWTQQDSWQIGGRWLSWDEAEQYAKTLNNECFAGHQDWRLPNKLEALTLLVPEKNNKDKYGNEIHLDPIFPEGSQAKVWTTDYTGNDAVIVDFQTGQTSELYKSKAGRMATRPVWGHLEEIRPPRK